MKPIISNTPTNFQSIEEIKNHKWYYNLAAPINYNTLQNIRKFIDNPKTSLDDKVIAIRIFFTKKYERNIYMTGDIEMFHQYHQFKSNNNIIP